MCLYKKGAVEKAFAKLKEFLTHNKTTNILYSVTNLFLQESGTSGLVL